jgi:sulfoxide reductase heme-binding subunit YedZ
MFGMLSAAPAPALPTIGAMTPARLRGIKLVLFAVALLPLLRLVVGFFAGHLGVNPIETITRSTGTWTLVFLLVTLSVTPLRRVTGQNWLIRLRRMLGLFAFFYACLHFTTYIWLDQFFDLAAIGKDILKRPFITIGFVCLLTLLPLALTSTDAMLRRLGGKRWRALHRLAYLAPALGVIHYWWLVKRDITQPALYATVLAVLLLLRVVWWRRERRG